MDLLMVAHVTLWTPFLKEGFSATLQDPYGYSSIGLLQAETMPELIEAFQTFFSKAGVSRCWSQLIAQFFA